VNGGTLIMESGARLTGNKNSDGGGVYVWPTAMFIMNGGTISGNKADSGGGVYVSSYATFRKTGGTIYGNDINPGENTATSGDGHAVYKGGNDEKRNGTAWPGPEGNLDSTKTGSDGGWDP
jgi:hypothetical protein